MPFFTHQTSGTCAGVCTCNCMHQMENTDVGDDIHVKASSQTTYKIRPPDRISKDQYTQSFRQLNEKQRAFFYTALHH